VLAGGGAGWVCGVDSGAAVEVAVNAGAVLAGTREAGFWAVWHDEAVKARTASVAIRTWSFATRIFICQMRIAPLGSKSAEFCQKS